MLTFRLKVFSERLLSHSAQFANDNTVICIKQTTNRDAIRYRREPTNRNGEKENSRRGNEKESDRGEL